MNTEKTRAIVLEALKNMLIFRGRIFIIKISGSIADHPDRLAAVLQDIDILSRLGIKPVIIHGAGNAINDAMRHAGLIPEFIEGERVTPEPVLDIVVRIQMEMNAKIITATRDFESHFMAPTELESDGNPIMSAVRKNPDLGFVGKIDWVNTEHMFSILDDGHIPVIPSLACGPRGLPYNVNADDVACTIAIALKAEKLIIISDVPGVKHGGRLLETIDKKTSERLILNGVISAGMVPKVRSTFEAIEGGVRSAHLIKGDSSRHSYSWKS